MRHQMFVQYDSKADAYSLPFWAVTVPAAIRSFTDMALNPETLVNRHPGDFTLFHVGEYDDVSGRVSMFDVKSNLGLASEFMTAAERFALRGGNGQVPPERDEAPVFAGAERDDSEV